MKLDDGSILLAIAIMCLTVLEVVAIYNQLNGTMFATVIGAITTLIGYYFGKRTAAKE